MSKLAIKYQGNLRKLKHVKQIKSTQVYCANGSKNQQKKFDAYWHYHLGLRS